MCIVRSPSLGREIDIAPICYLRNPYSNPMRRCNRSLFILQQFVAICIYKQEQTPYPCYLICSSIAHIYVVLQSFKQFQNLLHSCLSCLHLPGDISCTHVDFSDIRRYGMGIHLLRLQYRSVQPHAPAGYQLSQATEILQLGEQERPQMCDLAICKYGKKIHTSASKSIPYFDREVAIAEPINTKTRRGSEWKDARHQTTRRPHQQVRSVEGCEDVQSSIGQLTLDYAQR